MNQKKDLLLDKIIQRYIQFQEPVGSESLKMSMSMKISSATIRNYFKILSDEGVLMQPHISSGRVPTDLALKNHWRNQLNFKDNLKVDLKKFKKACEDNGIFGIIKENSSETLKEVINYEDKYLILDFGDSQIVLDFNHTIERFAKELVGLNIEDIKKIAHQVCAISLLKKLEQISQDCHLFYSGIEFLGFLLQIPDFQDLFFEIIEGKIFDRLQTGIYFEKTIPKGNLAIIQDITLEEKAARMFCLGALDRNYTNFYEEVAS